MQPAQPSLSAQVNVADQIAAQAALKARFDQYNRTYGKNPGSFDKIHDKTKGFGIAFFI